jgi:hypothetical protein
MTKPLPTVLFVNMLVMSAGCVRPLLDAQCPCLDGWICCEQQNVCRPAGSSCEGDAAAPGGDDAEVPPEDAAAPPEDADEPAEDGGQDDADAAPDPIDGSHQQPPPDAGDASDGAEPDGSIPDDCPVEAPSDGMVCMGSYTIMNSTDLAAIANCQRITGDLTVGTGGLDEVRFEKLARVDGVVTLTGSAAIVFAELVHVGGYFVTLDATDLRALTAPKLRSAGSGMIVVAGSASFACLRHLVRLEMIGETLSIPRLESVDFMLAVDGVRQLVVPRLHTAEVVLLQRVAEASFPALTSLRVLSAEDGHHLLAPNLGEMNDVSVQRYDTVDLGVTSVTAGTNASGAISLYEVGTATFPRLVQCDDLRLSLRDRASFPALKSARDLEVGQTTTTSVTGVVLEFPELETGRYLSLGSNGSDTQSGPRIASFVAGKLRSARNLIVANTTALSELSLPLLQTLDDPGRIAINRNADLAVFWLPALTTVTNLAVGRLTTPNCSARICQPEIPQGNPLLVDFDLSGLQRGQVDFINNASLPQCKVDALAQQLTQAGLGGTVTSSGNSPSCPP